jgi:hypothetical protein
MIESIDFWAMLVGNDSGVGEFAHSGVLPRISRTGSGRSNGLRMIIRSGACGLSSDFLQWKEQKEVVHKLEQTFARKMSLQLPRSNRLGKRADVK